MPDFFRVFAYIDGLNLYHAILNLCNPALLRCDVRALVGGFLQNRDVLETVNYYSTLPRHLSKKTQEAFLRYAEALAANDVNVIRGQFKEISIPMQPAKIFHAQNALLPEGRRLPDIFYLTKHEEKETDVNIAIDMVLDAFENKYDKAILVSGDSDLMPAVRRVLEKSPNKQITILMPAAHRLGEAYRLKKVSPNLNIAKIRAEHLTAL